LCGTVDATGYEALYISIIYLPTVQFI